MNKPEAYSLILMRSGITYANGKFVFTSQLVDALNKGGWPSNLRYVSNTLRESGCFHGIVHLGGVRGRGAAWTYFDFNDVLYYYHLTAHANEFDQEPQDFNLRKSMKEMQEKVGVALSYINFNDKVLIRDLSYALDAYGAGGKFSKKQKNLLRLVIPNLDNLGERTIKIIRDVVTEPKNNLEKRIFKVDEFYKEKLKIVMAVKKVPEKFTPGKIDLQFVKMYKTYF